MIQKISTPQPIIILLIEPMIVIIIWLKMNQLLGIETSYSILMFNLEITTRIMLIKALATTSIQKQLKVSMMVLISNIITTIAKRETVQMKGPQMLRLVNFSSRTQMSNQLIKPQKPEKTYLLSKKVTMMGLAQVLTIWKKDWLLISTNLTAMLEIH